MRAKFRCSSCRKVTKLYQAGSNGPEEEVKTREEVEFYPVHSENESWSKGAPVGNLSLIIDNSEMFGHFEVGGEYHLDFTRAH